MQTGDPQRGDIVVFNSKVADTRLIKRLIGVPGDVIAMRNNRLVINGVTSNYQLHTDSIKGTESFGDIQHLVQFLPVANAIDNFEAVTVPSGHYLVLGDNRNNSSDSRYIGFVPEIEIQGKAKKVIVSLDPENYYLPRKERTLHPLI